MTGGCEGSILHGHISMGFVKRGLRLVLTVKIVQIISANNASVGDNNVDTFMGRIRKRSIKNCDLLIPITNIAFDKFRVAKIS